MAVGVGVGVGVRAGRTCLPHLLPHAPTSSSSHTFASLIPSSKANNNGIDRANSCQIIHLAQHLRSPFLGTGTGKLWRSQSLGSERGRRRDKQHTLRRAMSDSLESFKGSSDDDDEDDDDEGFMRRLQELALELRRENDQLDMDAFLERRDQGDSSSSSSSAISLSSEPWLGIDPEPDWPERDEVVPASVERNANSVELPLSLRIIKRKMRRWEEGVVEAGESAIKKAFSSMVFIIRELQSHVLQMRESLPYEDLQGILARVHQEMHASFVWLFQQIFSCTPTLMVSLMLLLANYTVYSMGHHAAIAATTTSPANPPAHHQSFVTVAENHNQHKEERNQPRFDPSSIKTFYVNGRTASIGGSGGGGRKVRPVAGSTDDGRSDGSYSRYPSRTIFPDGISRVPASFTEEEAGDCGVAAAAAVTEEDEEMVWNRIVEEASRMQASSRDEALTDHETLQRFVSPVTVEMEPDDYSDYFRTELQYHRLVSQDPNNPLLLSNFAQFLYLVVGDIDRAESYFKRAVGMEPADAEALNRYAGFLWVARKDLGAAEETYLEAIAADPSNTVYAANYAHFLWNTGGEDTCYPLDDDAC